MKKQKFTNKSLKLKKSRIANLEAISGGADKGTLVTGFCTVKCITQWFKCSILYCYTESYIACPDPGNTTAAD